MLDTVYESEDLETYYNNWGSKFVLFLTVNLETNKVTYHIRKDGKPYRKFETYKEALEHFNNIKG